jgi:hypothetical protein
MRRPAIGRHRAASLATAMCLLAATAFAPVATLATVGDNAGITISVPTGLRVSGRITNTAGVSIAGASVAICKTTDYCEWNGVTAGDGTYSVRGVPAGTYYVAVYEPDNSAYIGGWYRSTGYVADPADAGTIVVGAANVVGINLKLPRGLTISGVVRGPGSVPIPNVQVFTSGGPDGGSDITDGSGAFQILGVLSGTYALEVRMPNGVDFVSGSVTGDPMSSATVTESGGTAFAVVADVTGIVITAPLGRRLSGKLTGSEASTATVEAFANTASRQAAVHADGTWSVGGLWPDSYQLVFTPPTPGDVSLFALGYWANTATLTYDYSAATPIVVTTTDITALNAAIPTGVAISGSVTTTSGAPLANAFLRMCGDGSIGCASRLTAADGTWRFAHAVPGNYTVHAAERGHVEGWYGAGGFTPDETSATALHLGASNIGGIQVKLPNGFAIGGRVTGPGGVAVSGAFVRGSSGAGVSQGGSGWDTTAADGSFHLRGLSTGLYAISVSFEQASDYRPGWYSSSAAGGYTLDYAKRSQIAVPAVGASFVAISPKRVADSRAPLGFSGVLAANVSQSFAVAGIAGIPAGATAVTGTITVIGPTSAGYVALTPAPTTSSTTSAISFRASETRTNNFTMRLASGKLAAVFRATAGKTAHVLVDITGYYLPGTTHATYSVLGSVRVMDTRPSPLRVGPLGRFSAGVAQTLSVAGANGVPADAVAITGRISALGATASGSLAITPAPPAGAPTTSALAVTPTEMRANGLTAALNASGDLTITYSAVAGAKVDVLLDVTGYYRNNSSGLLFYSLKPERILDSRPGAVGSGLTGAFVSGTPRTMTVGGGWSTPAGAKAITGNLTAVAQTAAGYVAITRDPNPSPPTSTLTFPLGDTRAIGVTVPLNATGRLSFVYKATAGATTHLLLDVTGFFH